MRGACIRLSRMMPVPLGYHTIIPRCFSTPYLYIYIYSTVKPEKHCVLTPVLTPHLAVLTPAVLTPVLTPHLAVLTPAVLTPKLVF